MATQREKFSIAAMVVITATTFSSLLPGPSFAQSKPSAATLESAIEPASATARMKRCDKLVISPVQANPSGRKASPDFSLSLKKGQKVCIRTSRPGIVFHLRKDKQGPNDPVVAANVRSGEYIVVRPDLLKKIYISNPRNTGGKKFVVTFKK